MSAGLGGHCSAEKYFARRKCPLGFPSMLVSAPSSWRDGAVRCEKSGEAPRAGPNRRLLEGVRRIAPMHVGHQPRPFWGRHPAVVDAPSAGAVGVVVKT